jgi:hypothetical protein
MLGGISSGIGLTFPGDGCLYRLEEETEADWWEVEALYDLCFAPGRTALSSYRLRDGVPTVAALVDRLEAEYRAGLADLNGVR